MKVGSFSLEFPNVYIKEVATVAGPKEGSGPLGKEFDLVHSDLYMNKDTYEQAEIALLSDCFAILINKSGLGYEGIEAVISGDLINQNVISNYTMRNINIPYLGIYSACSTSTLGLIVGASIIQNGFNNVITMTSSHNATAERQYRYPTEYGGQKPDRSTYTVTASGACLLSSDSSNLRVTKATIGKVIDAGESDPYDMGSAMAPAAAVTIYEHLTDFGLDSSYYDVILTGDLSKIGTRTLKDILKNEYNIDITLNHLDCGNLIYGYDDKSVFSGGSGAGCSASVFYGHIVKLMLKKKYKRVLFCATGALMNPVMINQKETIPAICHAVAIEVVE